MAIAVMNWVWKHSRAKNSARLVLLAIADCCNNDDGTGAWPSMAALVAKTNLSLRAVQVAIRDLEKLKELKIDRNAGSAGQHVYTVLIRGDAGSAPPQNLHRAESAPPAESARPPADPARENAGSAPGTIKEPSGNQEPPYARGGRADDWAKPRTTVEGAQLLKEHIAACRQRPSKDLLIQTSQKIDELLAEDHITADMVRAGLTLLRVKPHLSPRLLSNLVFEAGNSRQLKATGTDGPSAARSGPLADVNNRDWSGWVDRGPNGGNR